ILLFIGLKGLSDYYKDQSIVGHAFKGLIFGIIGSIAATALTLTLFLGFFTIAPATDGIFAAIGAIALTIVILVVAFVFYLLMAMNLRRAFNTLAERSGENMFRTAGTLLWIGAILTIIAVGLILVWFAWLILAIAFFSMKLAPTQPYNQPYQAPPPTSTGTAPAGRYCPNCGSPVDANATFCPHCGKQLPPA
ncbi:MAG TPA: DUF996 domain-containing protein, partial [Candidatus Acidoferrales bacterium]|nr:DUF996 domain-containing protein [Candidatus Acidoferrales bacterium]